MQNSSSGGAVPQPVRRLAGVLLGTHALGLYVLAGRPSASLFSDLMQVIVAAVAASAFALASRSGKGIHGRTCLLLAYALGFWALGQLTLTYYVDFSHRIVPAVSLSDVFFFAYYVPVAAAFLLPWSEHHDGPMKWVPLLDFAQVAIVIVSIYLYFLVFLPSVTSDRAQMLRGVVGVYFLFDSLVVAGFLLRTMSCPAGSLRRFYGRLSAIFSLYLAGTVVYAVSLLSFGWPGAGTWVDLSFTLPWAAGTLLLSRWEPSSGEIEADSAAQQKTSSLLYLFLPPATVVLLAMFIAAHVPQLSVAVITASFVCYALRLAVTHRAQQAALERMDALQEKFAKAFQSAPDSMTISTLEDGRYLEVNEQFLGFTGYRADEVLDHTSIELGIWADPSDRLKFIGQLREGATLRNFPAALRSKSGAVRHVLLSAQVIAFQGQKYIVSGVLDISERELAQAKILDWKNRYEATVLASGQILYDWEVKTNTLTLGGSLESILGYSAGEIANGPNEWRELIHPDDLERYKKEVGSVLAGSKGPLHSEYRMRDKSGAYITVKDDGHCIRDASGNAVRMVGFVADVTEQRLLETQLRQSQKMEAVGRLSGGVAHDFNNLLTVITGYSQLLMEGIAPADTLHHAAEEIKSAADRAAALTRQLLAFSRQQVLQPRIINLNNIIQSLEKMLRRLIGEDIEIITHTATDLGSVRVDPGQIEQIIMNLAVNARDAMPNGGKLTLETANAELDEAYGIEHFGTGPGKYVMLVVTDTGTGMDEETKARMFEPFFTTKELGKGTGLGLSTVYGIVRQSDGRIWVYSEPGHGTTFKIYLPRVDEPAQTVTSGKPQRAVARGTETILLVEDDPALRDLANAILSASGYSVLVARNPGDVDDLCRQHREKLALLLTDVVMPSTNGPELARRVRGLVPRIKVILMSGYTDRNLPGDMVLDDATTFLQKPFTPGALTEKVREVLD